ncbi:MAG: hypothetical protein ACREX0_12010 [Noviherbaspirillum sp.]
MATAIPKSWERFFCSINRKRIVRGAVDKHRAQANIGGGANVI